MTEQLAELPLPLSVQLPLLLKLPMPSLVKLTVPLGVLLVPPELSLTVAVQLVELSTGVVLGVQLTLVLVERKVTVSVAGVVLVLPACLVSAASGV